MIGDEDLEDVRGDLEAGKMGVPETGTGSDRCC